MNFVLVQHGLAGENFYFKGWGDRHFSKVGGCPNRGGVQIGGDKTPLHTMLFVSPEFLNFSPTCRIGLALSIRFLKHDFKITSVLVF